MWRTVQLFGSALLAAWAIHLALGQTGSAPFYVRDGLLIATLAVLLFAWRAGPPRSIRPTGVAYHWPAIGRALWGAGLATSVAALFAFALDNEGAFVGALSITLWLIGPLLMLIGAFWRGPVRDFSQQAHRWERNQRGELIRVGTDGSPRSDPKRTGYLPGLAIFIGLIVVLGLGSFLRLWQLSLPATCVGTECATAMALIAGPDPSIVLHLPKPSSLLAQWLMRFVEDDIIYSMRLSAAIFGIASLLTLFFALKKIVIAESALLGTWLMALSGWHIAISRAGGPSSATIFAITLGIWATFQALGSRDRRWWVVMGVLLGGIALTAPTLTLAVWLWAGLIVLILSIMQRRVFIPSLLSLFIAMAISLPTAFVDGNSVTIFIRFADASSGLIRDLVGTISPATSLSPQSWFLLSLTVLGIGYLLRYVNRPATSVLLAGLAAVTTTIFLDVASTSTSTPVITTVMTPSMMALFPFALIAATLAGDQLLRALVDPWRQVVRPAYFVATAFIVLALFGVRSLDDLPEQTTANVADPAQPAMLDYLAERFTDGSAVDAVHYVPPTLVENPAFQIQGADWLESGQVLPMASIEQILFDNTASSELSVLVAGVDTTLLNLLTAFFPNSTVEPHFDDEIGQLLFHTMTISPQDRSWPGLVGRYLADRDPPELLFEQRDAPLDFDWRATAPESPFVATWQGSLRVPTAGRYTFSANGITGEEEEITVLLDNEILLASELNLIEQEKTLSQGLYPIDIRYASGEAPSNLTLSWTRPDGVTEPIPPANLTTRTLPNLGLEGAYFANAAFQPPALSLRKDLRFDRVFDDSEAQSVVWTGKVAANRAGEYLFALVDDGDSRLLIDGQLLVDNTGVDEDSETPGYVEGIAYLEAGWHDIEIRYVPDGQASALKVLWQPPGSQATALSAVYLSPIQGAVNPLDLPLPNPPGLVNLSNGEDDFALSYNLEFRQARTTTLPDSLPSLPMTLAWQAAGGCGSGDAQMAWPHGVAIDADTERIYVADSGNWRIAIYDLDGRWIDSVTSDSFEEPHDIGVSPDGQITLLDAVASPLQQFNPSTNTIEPIPLDTGFYRPRGLSAASAGVIAVADTGGGRVVLLTPDGTLLAEYGSPDSAFGRGQPVDVTLTGRALWGITAEDGRLWDLNTNGSLAVVQPTTTLDGPQIAALLDGSLLVTDPERNQLLYLRDDGRPLASFSFDGLLGRPTGIDVTLVNGEPFVAIVDTALCSLSLWRLDAL